LGLFIAFGFDEPLKETSFLSSSQSNSTTYTHTERERQRERERASVAREKKKEESVRPVSRVKRIGTKLVRNVAARTQNTNESLYGGSNAELRIKEREQLPDVIPPRKDMRERRHLFVSPFSFSPALSLCTVRVRNKIERKEFVKNF
jgi:hypothetical protein